MRYTIELQPLVKYDDYGKPFYDGHSTVATVYNEDWNWQVDIYKSTYSAAYSAARRWIDKKMASEVK